MKLSETINTELGIQGVAMTTQENRQYWYSLISDLSAALKEHDALETLIKTANGYALDMAQIEISE